MNKAQLLQEENKRLRSECALQSHSILSYEKCLREKDSQYVLQESNLTQLLKKTECLQTDNNRANEYVLKLEEEHKLNQAKIMVLEKKEQNLNEILTMVTFWLKKQKESAVHIQNSARNEMIAKERFKTKIQNNFNEQLSEAEAKFKHILDTRTELYLSERARLTKIIETLKSKIDFLEEERLEEVPRIAFDFKPAKKQRKKQEQRKLNIPKRPPSPVKRTDEDGRPTPKHYSPKLYTAGTLDLDVINLLRSND